MFIQDTTRTSPQEALYRYVPCNHINGGIPIALDKDIDNFLKDCWLVEESTNIIEAINPLEGKVG